MHEGSLLRNLVKDLKRENGTIRADIAGKMGITPEHLSTVFNRERLTAEIKSRAIKALNLPPDFFDEKEEGGEGEPKPDWEAEARRLEIKLREILEKYVTLLEKVNAEKDSDDKEKTEWILGSK